jgi:hypothetical protein
VHNLPFLCGKIASNDRFPFASGVFSTTPLPQPQTLKEGVDLAPGIKLSRTALGLFAGYPPFSSNVQELEKISRPYSRDQTTGVLLSP